jgi:ApbE superfamily uncharacterized protein (UPF0280 family)
VKRYQIRIDETVASVITHPDYIPVIEDGVRDARAQIIEYIERNACFETSHLPIKVAVDAPDIVKHMADASKRAGVGPMAAVAGAIAQHAAECAVNSGADHVVFENGGDIAMYLKHPIIVGIYTGSQDPIGLGFKVTQTGTMLGLCTSSATVGHSLSYGKTDASITYSGDCALADASATALGNAVSRNNLALIESSLNKTMISGIYGAMVIIEDTIGIRGYLPEIIRARIEHRLISKGWEGWP